MRIRPLDVNPNESFTTDELSSFMNTALIAKFSQNEELNNILKLTNDAKIVVFIPRKPAKPFINLMIV